MGSGPGCSAPLGTCLLASSFLRWSQVFQEESDVFLSPIPSLPLQVPFVGGLQKAGFAPQLLRKALPFLWGGGRHFLWSLSTLWYPSVDPRPTSGALWGGLITIQYQRASIIHAHLFPSALLGQRPTRGRWELISFHFYSLSSLQTSAIDFSAFGEAWEGDIGLTNSENTGEVSLKALL